MNFLSNLFNHPEKNLNSLVEYFDYFSTICADKKLTDKMLSKIKKCDYSKVPEQDFENAIRYISTNRIMFREPQLIKYFYEELNNHFILNFNNPNVKIIFDKIHLVQCFEFEKQRKNIITPNPFNAIEFGVILKDIYENNYKIFLVNKERDYLNNNIVISCDSKVNIQKKSRI